MFRSSLITNLSHFLQCRRQDTQRANLITSPRLIAQRTGRDCESEAHLTNALSHSPNLRDCEQAGTPSPADLPLRAPHDQHPVAERQTLDHIQMKHSRQKDVVRLTIKHLRHCTTI
jgi:hypothetical protein